MKVHRFRHRVSITLAVCMSLNMMGSVASAQYAEAVLADNPNGYWRFNEPDGDIALNAGSDDLEGEYFGGQRPAITEFTLVDGRVANGFGADNLAFQVGDEADEYMSVIEPFLSDQSEFTMTGWVNPGPRDGGRIGLFGQNDVIEFGFISPNQIQLWTPAGAGQVLNYPIDPDNEIPEDTWFHVGAVGRGTGLELYVNGREVFNTDQSGYGASGFDFNIGGGGIYDGPDANFGNQFTGRLDDVAVWKSALTEEQLQAHVQAAKTDGGDYAQTVLADTPLGFWDLDETSGDTALNRGVGGAELNGTYNGGDQNVPGANETFPGFAANNSAFEVESPDPGFVAVDGEIFNDAKEFTMSGWVKPGFIADDRVGLFGKNDALEFGFINPNTLQMWTPEGGSINFDIFDEIEEEEWVHIAAVGDGEELTIYVDGEVVAVGGSAIGGGGQPVDSYGASDFPFNVGGGGIYDVEGNQFTGSVDEIAVWTEALSPEQIMAHFQAALGGGVVGDFDGDGQLTANDIDLLSAEVRAGTNMPQFDLNGDNLVNDADRNVWVKDLKTTYFGDADLNGEFNSTDFVVVFTAGKYENGEEAGWAEGDWDGNAFFDSSDFVAAFTDGGYELGPIMAAQSVPEPATGVLSATALVACVICLRRKRS